MKVLVTGANGFLGRHVVAEFLRRGHTVVAMVRPAVRLDGIGWPAQVAVYRADLRTGRNLEGAFDGVDAVVHLAACVTGDEETQFASTVVGTERLLEAMARSGSRRLILASSFSVYGWSRIRGTLTEDSPLELDVYARDGYAVAKIWQERIARRAAERHGWSLTVLRPGFIWGRGHEELACLGLRVGRFYLSISPLARLPLTHVENCADCFVTATESAAAAGKIYNVVDDDTMRAWTYLGRLLREQGGGIRIPVPYLAALSVSKVARTVSRLLFGPAGKLPSILVPIRFQARFKPLRYSNRKLQEELNWVPPLSFEQCLDRTYGAVELAREREPQPVGVCRV